MAIMLFVAELGQKEPDYIWKFSEIQCIQIESVSKSQIIAIVQKPFDNFLPFHKGFQ